MTEYDVIGDIHGQHEKLTRLLGALGYRAQSGTFKHPAGRRALFLGDYIDRGPAVREVLTTVRAMVESGDALAIIGNHEYNAISHSVAGGARIWQPNHAGLPPDFRQTLAQFSGREAEWSEWLAWLRQLPLFLDLGGLRAVHACWDPLAIATLAGQSLLDDGFWETGSSRHRERTQALDRLLNGPAIAVPDGALVLNPKGMPMPSVRIRWWDLPSNPVELCELALPDSLEGRGLIAPERLKGLPSYPADAPPVFFGHYWLSPDRELAPLAPNIACLDFSAAYKGALVAYRWDGERALSATKYFSADRSA
jgi:hypothetical protein